MFKNVLCLIIIVITYNNVSAQVHSGNQILVNGKITGKIIGSDTIYFNTGIIDKKYFEISSISAIVRNNEFSIKTTLPYPQMFRIVLSSDRNIRVWRLGKYFIDQSTNFIKINYSSEECNEAGQTH